MKWVLCGIGVILGLLAAQALLTVLLAALTPKTKFYERDNKFYRLVLNVDTAILGGILRVKIRKTGFELLPKGQKLLLVCNHRSNFDPIFSWLALRHITPAFVSKKENFDVPFFGRIIRRLCFLPIDRENPRKAAETVHRASALIASGEASVCLYPEGTRSKDCVLLPFHDGVFRIAQKAGAPIAVMVIRGTEKVHKNFPLHGTEIGMDIVGLLPAEQVRTMRTSEIGELVREMMENKLM